MKKMVAVLFGFALLGGQGKAHADVIVATFSGQVGGIYDPANGQFTLGIHPGSTFGATVRYDSKPHHSSPTAPTPRRTPSCPRRSALAIEYLTLTGVTPPLPPPSRSRMTHMRLIPLPPMTA
jgi:hypothetical protein